MECPFKIEPHQIQGLDYINIFPVVKWLVKKAIETRQLEGDKVRAFAVNQYHKEHQHTEVRFHEILSIFKQILNNQSSIFTTLKSNLHPLLYRVFHYKDGYYTTLEKTLGDVTLKASIPRFFPMFSRL